MALNLYYKSVGQKIAPLCFCTILYKICFDLRLYGMLFFLCSAPRCVKLAPIAFIIALFITLLSISPLVLSAPADGIVTWSSTDKNANVTLSDNGLDAAISGSAGAGYFGVRSNQAMSPGDGFFYFELEQLIGASYAIGVAPASVPITTSDDLETFFAANTNAGVLSDVFVGVLGIAVDYRGGHPTVYFMGNDVFEQTPDAVASRAPEVDMTSVTEPVYIYVLASSGAQFRLNFGGEEGADFDWNPIEMLDDSLYNIDSVLEYGWPVPQAKPTLIITEGSQLVEQNGSVSFSASASNASSEDISSSVGWYLDNSLIGTGSTISPSTTTPGIYSLKAEVTDAIGLKTTATVGYFVHPSAAGALLDQDMDGLTYTQELEESTDPGRYDSDGDGLSDGYEVANGTNPLVINSPIAIEPHQENIFFKFDFGGDASAVNTYNIITTSDDGFSVGYLPLGGKAAIKANQGMKGEFRYWEGQAFFDADMGFGLINPDEKIDDYCCVTSAPDFSDPEAAGPSMSVNMFNNNSIWRNLVNVGGFTNNDEYLGFAVDYRADDPIVYVIGSSGLQATLTLTDYPSADPIFPMVYGNAGEVELASRAGAAIQRGNFGQEPFFYDVETVLANADDEGTPLNIDVSDLVPGWGKYRQLQYLSIDTLSSEVNINSSLTLNASAKDASGVDASAVITWAVFDSSNTDVTSDVSPSTSVSSGVSSFTFTPDSISTYTVRAQMPDSKTGATFSRSAKVVSNPLFESDDPVFTFVPSNLEVRIPSGSSAPATLEAIASFLTSPIATDASGTPTITNDAPDNFPLGDTDVIFTATDLFDNKISTDPVTVTVTVTGEVPVISIPDGGIDIDLLSGTTLSLSDTGLLAFFDTITANDVEDGVLTGSITHNASTAFPAGIPVGSNNQVTFSVTDSQNNIGQAVASITVVDRGAPVISAVNDITVNSPSGAAVSVSQADIASFLSSVTASDDVEGSITVSNDAPASFPVGITTVAFSAADSGANAAEVQTGIVRITADQNSAVGEVVDSDGDRIPDTIDNNADPTELPLSDSAVMTSSPGMQLILGEVAFAASSPNATVSLMDISSYGDGGASVTDWDDSADGIYNYIRDIVDFEVINVPVGSSADIVIPQTAAIPEGASYRKYTSLRGWQDFDISISDTVASAPSSVGVCPAANDPAYVLGLTAGHDCVRLHIADGGPNDADGVANGVIKDPSGVAVEVNMTAARVERESEAPFVAGSGEQLVMTFDVSNNAGDAEVDGFTFTIDGAMDVTTDISGASLRADLDNDGTPELIATGVFDTVASTLTFTPSETLPLPISTSRFLIYYTF